MLLLPDPDPHRTLTVANAAIRALLHAVGDRPMDGGERAEYEQLRDVAVEAWQAVQAREREGEDDEAQAA